jgi:hypothetical protein
VFSVSQFPIPSFPFPFSNFPLPISLFLAGTLSVLASCGSPGDPRAPVPPVPVAVRDLAAQQSGESVVLTFTLPQTTVEGERLEALPEVEIFRAYVPPTAPADQPVAAKQVYTVPASLVATYLRAGRIEFADPIRPEDLALYAGQQAVYTVRTRASRRRASADSNLAAVRIYPVPQAIGDLAATVTAAAIELRWTPPERSTSGTALSLGGYRIYRGELTAAQPDAEKAPLTLLGIAPTADYRDAQFEFGRTYIYRVRSVAQYALDAVESAPSNLAAVEAKDVFPPAPPQNLVVIPVAAAGETPAHFELSWSISGETDLAGYNVYRVEAGASDTRPAKRNRELLPTPTFRDMSVVAGRGYTYSVTAVDRSGNESAPSAAVTASLNSGANENETHGNDSLPHPRPADFRWHPQSHRARGVAHRKLPLRGDGDLRARGQRAVVPGALRGNSQLGGARRVRGGDAHSAVVLRAQAFAIARLGAAGLDDFRPRLQADGRVL